MFHLWRKNILEIEVFSQKAVSCKDIEDFSDLFDKEKRKIYLQVRWNFQ